MADKLTPQQKMAVENRGGELLVSAAAGSGKTKVLVDRLMRYIMDPVDPANIDDFLIITYTKAAAAELRGKIADKLTEQIALQPGNRHLQQQMQRLYLAKISTVHAFCADILREFAYRLDIAADFRIAEENESIEMKYRVVENLLEEKYASETLDPDFLSFVDSQGLGRDDHQVPDIILQIHASALCHLNPLQWLDKCIEDANVVDITDAGQTVWGKYLIDEFKTFLQLQIRSLENCIHTAEEVSGMEKPATLLKQTVCQLKQLSECNNWDTIAAFPKVEFGTLTFKKDQRDGQLANQIKAIRNHCKDELAKKLRSFGSSSCAVLSGLQQTAVAAKGLVALVKQFKTVYDKYKSTRRILDFSDIEQKTLDLLLGKKRIAATSAAQEIGERFREIMVDEYQDTNEVQDAIFRTLTQDRHNCFMVGDVKQSIYQFRLADPGIFLKKYNNYLPAEEAQPGQGRKILLSSNFRSSGGVISAVNDVFMHCMSSKVGGLRYAQEEMLREGIPHIPINEPEVELYGIQVREDTYAEEASFVADKIRNLLDGKHMVRQGDVLRPIVPDDIVILLRSPNSVGGEYLYALQQQGIRCTMGSSGNLLITPEIEVLHSLLKTISNPLQDIPLLGCLASPLFGFTADDLALLRSKNKSLRVYELLCNDRSAKASNFLAILNDLRMDARLCTISQLIDCIYLKTDMLSIYGAMDDGEEKCSNLQTFSKLAIDFETLGKKDLSYFLEHLETLREKGMDSAGNSSVGTVRIMSIHKSKGLEFPVVILAGLSRSFNTSSVQKTVLCHKELGLGLVCANDKQRIRFPSLAKRAIAAKILEEDRSEELRVLYVAMTRARDRLIMTYATNKLEEELQDLAMRMDFSDPVLLTSDVDCPGTWILLTALKRTEAGEFFRLGGYPQVREVSPVPWSIHVVDAPEVVIGSVEEAIPKAVSLSALNKIRKGLSFQYPYEKITQIPSKLTATQLKGRGKDSEVSENTQISVPKHNFRLPSSQQLRGKDYGNAIHAVMQHICYENCSDVNTIRQEIQQLTADGLISEEQAALTDSQKIAAFFCSDIGAWVRSGKQILREFKFSILEDAGKYYDDAAGEKVLLQGVVDCAILEEDGITVIDFKSDYVTEETLPQKIQQYYGQVTVYANALTRIFKLPIKAAYLYFFSMDRFILL